jgi:hypothetical protein
MILSFNCFVREFILFSILVIAFVRVLILEL